MKNKKKNKNHKKLNKKILLKVHFHGVNKKNCEYNS